MELYSPEYSLKPIRTGENKPQMFVQKISIKFWVATDVWILAARSGAGVTQPGSPAPAAEFGACDRPVPDEIPALTGADLESQPSFGSAPS